MSATERAAHSQRRGAALIVVLLLLLSVTALGHGVFLIALEESSASRGSAAVLQSRIMAEGGVRRALRVSSADTLPDTGGGSLILAEGTLADAHFQAVLSRLSREIYLLEGTGAAALVAGGPMRVTARVTRLLWAPSPIERLRALSAVVEGGGGLTDPAGAVDPRGVRESTPYDAPAGCRDRAEAIDSVLAGRSLSTFRSVYLVGGRVPPLGLLVEDSLFARIPDRVSGSLTPRSAVDAGACVLSASGNWGSPSDPGGPCAGHRPARASEASLTLDGGEGQGILIVRGDLRLTRGAHYAGLVLVGGDLLLEDGALIEGMVRVAGSVRLSDGARLAGRICPGLLAIEAAHGLRLPLGLPGGGWLRPS